MTSSLQSIIKSENPFSLPVWIAGVMFLLLSILFLHILRVPLATFALVCAAAMLLWFAFRYSTSVLGLALACMPVFPVAILVARFFGPSYLMSDAAKACDRIVLLLLTCILLWRNGVKLKSPDWFLLACFGIALIRLVFGGTLLPLLSDFNLLIAYAAGRVTVLTAQQERTWAKCSVWIVSILSLLGMLEVFVFGEGPRTILYLAVADERETVQGALNATFHAEGFSGLRESATMIGPLQFASLCMVALIIWWVYHRRLWPGLAILGGLVCSVTRSAWVGAAVAIPFLAVVMEEKRRFLFYAALGLVLFLASVPFLGFSDYFFNMKTGRDPSAQGHQESLVLGAQYALEHPVGVGPGNAGMYGTKTDSNAVFIENTYLTLAAQYGLLTALCFLGFLISAIWSVWPQRTPLAYVAAGIVVGFGTVMMFAPLHDVFSLASWVWFPVGLAIRAS